MVQKTVKLLIFLNHNLVGFKNTRTFVLKEKGRFFGAVFAGGWIAASGGLSCGIGRE